MNLTNCLNTKCKELTVLGEDPTHYFGCAKDIEDFINCRKLKKVDRNLRKEIRSLIAHHLSNYIDKNGVIDRCNIKKLM